MRISLKNKQMVKKKESILDKKAQISIFVILAILISIVLIVLFLNRSGLNVIVSGESPVNQIEKCIQDNLKTGTQIISSQGGTMDPKNYFLYEDNKIEYLCYTNEYYKTCVMQKPLLKQSIEKELKNYLEPKTDSCMKAIKDSYEKKGYSFVYKKPVINVEIVPDNIIVTSEVDLSISKDKTESYKTIKTSISSYLYGFIMTSSSIANWEARYGNSETLSYMLYYPQLKVEKKMRSDGTRIYILTNRNSLDKFMFAIRSMAFPSGITGQ
jgi:hypothetical protein